MQGYNAIAVLNPPADQLLMCRRRPTPVSGTENDLLWQSLDSDFFDITRFAGDGNLGHIVHQIQRAFLDRQEKFC